MGQSGRVKVRSNLLEYCMVNRSKFSLLDVSDKKQQLQNAVMEADRDENNFKVLRTFRLKESFCESFVVFYCISI